MAGGILAASGMLLASLATSLTHLYLSIGLLSGEALDKGRRGQRPPDFDLLPAHSWRLKEGLQESFVWHLYPEGKEVLEQ